MHYTRRHCKCSSRYNSLSWFATEHKEQVVVVFFGFFCFFFWGGRFKVLHQHVYLPLFPGTEGKVVPSLPHFGDSYHVKGKLIRWFTHIIRVLLKSDQLYLYSSIS